MLTTEQPYGTPMAQIKIEGEFDQKLPSRNKLNNVRQDSSEHSRELLPLSFSFLQNIRIFDFLFYKTNLSLYSFNLFSHS
jgi:hypothetical protein